MVINAEEAEPESLTLVSAYLDRAWIFSTNCAYVGIHPRLPDGTKIAAGPGVDPYCRWDVARHYHWFMKEKATTPLPDGKLPTISQLRDADEKTRLHWMRLTGPDAPIRVTLTEAIKRSMQECHHLWTWPASTYVVPSSEDNGSPNANGKRQRGGGGGAICRHPRRRRLAGSTRGMPSARSTMTSAPARTPARRGSCMSVTC